MLRTVFEGAAALYALPSALLKVQCKISKSGLCILELKFSLHSWGESGFVLCGLNYYVDVYLYVLK